MAFEGNYIIAFRVNLRLGEGVGTEHRGSISLDNGCLKYAWLFLF